MNTIIDKMASDLGVYNFDNENITYFKCRVIYSALSSWIKAIAMDQLIVSKEEERSGVSRRHIYERGNAVLDSLVKMHPETSYWFDIKECEDNPVKLLRNRLLNHGDLLNEGFDTNLTLPIVHTKQFISHYETVYGEILGRDIIYSGIATIRKNKVENLIETKTNAVEWLNNFIKNVCWSSLTSDTTERMFFDPTHKSTNNYSAWLNSLPKDHHEIVLARITVNKNEYEYYLLNMKKNLVHKIDPFLKEQGYHIQIMYALRKIANNSVIATVRHHGDHVHLKLYTHLPTNELIMLESYAWPDNHISDKLCWIMYDYIWNYIKPHFEMIGIQILEETYG